MRGWLVAGAALLVLVGGVALGGGFATVPDTAGPPAAAGEVIETGSYDVRIDGAELADGRLRLHAELVNRTGESDGYLPYNLVTVVLPDGTVLTTGSHDGVGGWRSGLDPDVPAQATIDFDLSGTPVPQRLRVLVRGLEPATGFLSGPDEKTPGPVRAAVDLEVSR